MFTYTALAKYGTFTLHNLVEFSRVGFPVHSCQSQLLEYVKLPLIQGHRHYFCS